MNIFASGAKHPADVLAGVSDQLTDSTVAQSLGAQRTCHRQRKSGRPTSAFPARSISHVGHVVEMGSKVEVRHALAELVIAMMEHPQAIGDGPILLFPRQTVNESRANDTVTVGANASRPGVTTRRRSAVGVAVQPFLNSHVSYENAARHEEKSI